MRATLLTCFLWSFFQQQLLSQHRLEKQLTMEDGLASNSLYAAFQDSKGYIWLATTNGVSRFDGKVFTNFTSNEGLPDNEIFAITEDAIGRIWLSCYNGEPCYIYNQKIYSATSDSLLKTISMAGYFRFSHFGKKLILTKSVGSSYEVDETGSFRALPLRGVYFVGFKNNLLNVGSSSTGEAVKYTLLDDNYLPVDSLVASQGANKDVYQLGENSFAFLSAAGHYERYEIRNHHFFHLPPINLSEQTKGLFYGGGKIWVNTEGQGLLPLNKNLSVELGNSAVFKEQTIQNFMIDREGNYWACTFGSGLWMSPNNGFLYYPTNLSHDRGDVLRMSSDGKDVYCGYANAVVRLRNGSSSKDTLLKLSEKLVDLYVDSNRLVVATARHLYLYDLNNNHQELVAVENIKCLYPRSTNSAVYGTHSGAFLWNFPHQQQAIHNGRAVAVFPRSNGDILIGTLYGLVVAKRNKRGEWQEEQVQKPAFLKNTRIACINELKGCILAGTTQRGLVLLKDGDYETVKLGTGRNDINCKRIFIDAQKTVWLATYSGLFKLQLGNSIHSYTVQQIRKFNGLLSDDVNDVLSLKDTVYAAGPEGISLFPTQSPLLADTSGPRLYLNAVEVNGVPYTWTDNEIHLPYDSNSVEIRFSAIDQRSLGNLLFKYRLRGMQRNWQYSKDNVIRFEAVPPGIYTLEILAMNSRNHWTTEALRFTISIKTAWWQSTWFLIVIILLGAGLINFIVRKNLSRKHREQIRRNVFQRHLAELELRAIKAQINPHFIFNTLNVIQYFINTNENEKAEESLNRMADLLRKTLDYSDQTTVPLTSEIDYLQNYLELEKLRFDENFVFTIHNEVPKEMGAFEIPPMVLQPHIENALRHGFRNKTVGLKQLDIYFKADHKQLICEIHDNGIGRKAAAAITAEHHNSRSRGTELSEAKLRMYAAITGKSINTEVEDRYLEDLKTAAGTTIRITISQ